MTWVERKTVTYRLKELPFDDEGKLSIMDLSIIRLHVPGYRYPVDIGSWCYTVRRKAVRMLFLPGFLFKRSNQVVLEFSEWILLENSSNFYGDFNALITHPVL